MCPTGTCTTFSPLHDCLPFNFEIALLRSASSLVYSRELAVHSKDVFARHERLAFFLLAKLQRRRK